MNTTHALQLSIIDCLSCGPPRPHDHVLSISGCSSLPALLLFSITFLSFCEFDPPRLKRLRNDGMGQGSREICRSRSGWLTVSNSSNSGILASSLLAISPSRIAPISAFTAEAFAIFPFACFFACIFCLCDAPDALYLSSVSSYSCLFADRSFHSDAK